MAKQTRDPFSITASIFALWQPFSSFEPSDSCSVQQSELHKNLTCSTQNFILDCCKHEALKVAWMGEVYINNDQYILLYDIIIRCPLSINLKLEIVRIIYSNLKSWYKALSHTLWLYILSAEAERFMAWRVIILFASFFLF